MQSHSNFDFQGHRGCRGLFPENSLEGFLYALDCGVTTLEMDVVITKDNKVLVSHEPFFNHEICSCFNGVEITEANEKDFNIYQLTYADITKIDCGSHPHPRFPNQGKIPTTKPLLKTVIDAVKQKLELQNKPLCQFNIEIKSSVETDTIYHPIYTEYSDLLVVLLIQSNILKNTTIQSFDVRVLNYLHQKYPRISLSFLVETDESMTAQLSKLDFTPSVYSPIYSLVDAQMVQLCKAKNIKLIPWTVNDIYNMQQLVGIGVDGIISDYPDQFRLLQF